MSEHECACNGGKKSEWSNWFSWFIVGFIMTGIIMSVRPDNCDKEAKKLTKQIQRLEANYIDLVDYQTSMNKVIANMTSVLSNQTQMIIELKNVAEIQMMSDGSPSEFDIDLPATEEMQPSTNGIDLSNVDLGPSLIDTAKNHPWLLFFKAQHD